VENWRSRGCRDGRKKLAAELSTNWKPIPHIPLPFKEVMADVIKVKPPEKGTQEKAKSKRPKT
jgi:hypothetical protein